MTSPTPKSNCCEKCNHKVRLTHRNRYECADKSCSCHPMQKPDKSGGSCCGLCLKPDYSQRVIGGGTACQYKCDVVNCSCHTPTSSEKGWADEFERICNSESLHGSACNSEQKEYCVCRMQHIKSFISQLLTRQRSKYLKIIEGMKKGSSVGEDYYIGYEMALQEVIEEIKDIKL